MTGGRSCGGPGARGRSCGGPGARGRARRAFGGLADRPLRGCPAVLVSGARGGTRYARCASSAQTTTARMTTCALARAAPETALLGGPRCAPERPPGTPSRATAWRAQKFDFSLTPPPHRQGRGRCPVRARRRRRERSLRGRRARSARFVRQTRGGCLSGACGTQAQRVPPRQAPKASTEGSPTEGRAASSAPAPRAAPAPLPARNPYPFLPATSAGSTSGRTEPQSVPRNFASYSVRCLPGRAGSVVSNQPL